MKTFGSSSVFSIGFELRSDPDGREASWGALEIFVGSRCLTRGWSRDRELLPVVELPLAPILEWLLNSWDLLLHEERLPFPGVRALTSVDWYLDSVHDKRHDNQFMQLLDARERWWKSHALGSVVPGFRVPDIHFRRFGQRIEISWSDAEWRATGPGAVMFEQPGSMRVDVEPVADALDLWCAALIEALSDQAGLGIDCDVLRAKRRDLRSVARQIPRIAIAARPWFDAVVQRVRSRAGLSTDELDAKDTERALLGIRTVGGGLYEKFPVPALLFRSTAPNLSIRDVEQLLDLCTGPVIPGLLANFQEPAAPPLLPMEVTEDGYQRALEFRRRWGIPVAEPLRGKYDIERVILPQLGVRVSDMLFEDTGTDGASVFGEDVPPTIAVNLNGRFARTSSGRRMTLAHELCHLLHDVEYDQVGIVSGPWAPAALERRANAFAAMLLAPHELLVACLPPNVATWGRDDLKRAMATIGIGVTTLTRQLQNLGWISQSEQMAWVEELSQ